MVRRASTPSMEPSFLLPARLFVYGIRSRYAAEVAEVLYRLGRDDAVFVDNMTEGPDKAPVEPTITAGELPPPAPDHGYVIPIFDPASRTIVADELRAAGRSSFPVVVDPTSVIARSARIGEGTVVNAAVVVAAHVRLGAFVHVNRSASIGHDNVIDDFASLGPGCVLAGSCHVGQSSFIGAGATLLPDARIGRGAIVGAGSVVLGSVPDGATVVGNPARVVRRGRQPDGSLGGDVASRGASEAG